MTLFTSGLRKKILFTLAAMGVATALAACSGPTVAPTPTASITQTELLAGAKAEGKVVAYLAFPDAVTKKLNDAFTAKYGITVQSTRLIQAEFNQKVQAEFDANQVVADVVAGSDPGAFTIWQDAKQLMALPYPAMPSAAAWPSNYRSTFSSAVQTNFYGIMYNTSLVSAADAPKTWEDLLKPSLTGKLLLLDPAAGTASQYQYNLLLDKLGADYLTKLGKQAKFVASGTPGSQSVGSGAASAYAPVVPPTFNTIKAAGQPVAVVYPTPTAGASVLAAVPAKAARTKAGTLYIDFMMSVEGQQILNAGGYTVLPNVTGVDQVPSYVVPADYAQTVKNADQIIKLLKG